MMICKAVAEIMGIMCVRGKPINQIVAVLAALYLAGCSTLARQSCALTSADQRCQSEVTTYQEAVRWTAGPDFAGSLPGHLWLRDGRGTQ